MGCGAEPGVGTNYWEEVDISKEVGHQAQGTAKDLPEGSGGL